ncbi:glutamyl-tRNA reductase [Hydrogenovibrio kuenenii]|uniref:glutamyl-tRNA reductase n=1 Tax=Hydrogenovibrio kuenenii TaxID=63658 RepID=UPI00046701A0|nr:glutamyl-tRNA reductase [Hydrogenovibrio kuenenii]
MKLFVLGVNHKTAPVDVREKVSFSPEQVQHALAELKEKCPSDEYMILSTCNRTEIYCNLKTLESNTIEQWLHDYFELTPNSLTNYLYQKSDLDAIKHIMRVSSGLNSLILGEPQIFGQIKDAYTLAQKSDSIHQRMDALFQHIFKTVKQVRTDTAIGSSPVSVAFSAVALSKQFFGDLSEQTALLLGAGETIELVARHLKEHNIGKLIIANRTIAKAHQITETLGGYAIGLNEIEDHLHEADIIISSTASPTPLLQKDDIKAALKARRHKPIFIVDIAVPRDIAPDVGQLDNAYLYTVDDLTAIIEENKQSRKDASLEAEEIVSTQAENFMMQYHASLQASPIIQDYRKHAYELKELALEDALQQLQKGEKPEQVIKKLANQLTNKILHTPTANIHQAGLKGEQHIIDAAKALLFEADKPNNKPTY